MLWTREVHVSDVMLMNAVEFQGFFCAWMGRSMHLAWNYCKTTYFSCGDTFSLNTCGNGWRRLQPNTHEQAQYEAAGSVTHVRASEKIVSKT